MTTKAKTIIIHADEAPSIKELVDTISRLKKDYRLLSRIRGSQDIERPESFKQVIGFLESFLKKGKRKLNKEPEELKEIFRVSVECLIELAENEPELASSIMEETNFNERIGGYVTKSNNN